VSISLLGRVVEDELELELQGKLQRVCIVRLEKAKYSDGDGGIDDFPLAEPVQVSSAGRIVRAEPPVFSEQDSEQDESVDVVGANVSLPLTDAVQLPHELSVEAYDESLTLDRTEPFPDPRTATRHEVLTSLVAVVRGLGPMYSNHAYREYLARAGIKKLGRAIEERLNSAIEVAIVSGQLQDISEHDFVESRGMLIKLDDQPHYLIRSNLSRSLDEIPGNEIRAVSNKVKDTQAYLDDEEHMRSVLSFYGMIRLTEHTRQVLKEAIAVKKS
jgi:hypothetical protein